MTATSSAQDRPAREGGKEDGWSLPSGREKKEVSGYAVSSRPQQGGGEKPGAHHVIIKPINGGKRGGRWTCRNLLVVKGRDGLASTEERREKRMGGRGPIRTFDAARGEGRSRLIGLVSRPRKGRQGVKR